MSIKKKIISILFTVLFIIISVTLYETDKKYEALKIKSKKQEAIIQNQVSFINDQNLTHEQLVKKKVGKYIVQKDQ